MPFDVLSVPCGTRSYIKRALVYPFESLRPLVPRIMRLNFSFDDFKRLGYDGRETSYHEEPLG
jgi:hypothetical protein